MRGIVMSFYKLGLMWEMVYALECQNIQSPTPIQNLSIPPILNQKDLLAEAETGSGKTLAFLLPVIQNIDLEKGVQAIVIAPTRELALQITEEAKKLTEMKAIGILAAYGGQDIKAQLHRLNESVHLIIATPGRLLDHLKRGSFSVAGLKTLVVDEADQLFHIGFKEELKKIIKFLPNDRQTLCFSATLSHRVNVFSNHYLKDPVHILIPKKKIIVDHIEQFLVETSNRKKYDDFKDVLKQEMPSKAIVFCRSRRGCQALFENMYNDKYSVDLLHGGLTQAKREYVMNRFKKTDLTYLVATDVAARGLDIMDISHVFNYNLPDEAENYVHRIGRTARAGKKGKAFILFTQKDRKRLEAIEEFINQSIEKV